MSSARKTKKEGVSREPGFEEAVGRLEVIVQELEGGEASLERALELFEEGVKLSRVCHAKLSEAEKKVMVLMRSENGDLREEPFEEEEEGEEAEGPDGLF